MAENETLDLGRARRWRRVSKAVRADKSPEDVATLMKLCLYQTINGLRKSLQPNGPPQVSLNDLLQAWEVGPEQIRRVVRRCGGHEFAELFYDSSCDAPTKQSAVENFLSATCERFSDQIIEAVDTANQLNLSSARDTLVHAFKLLRPAIVGLASKIVADPAQKHRVPKQSAQAVAISTNSVLNESLLGESS